MTQVEVNSIKLAINLFQADRQIQLDEAASAPSCQMSLSTMTAAAVSAWTLHCWDAAAAFKLYHPSPFELFILPNYCYLHTFIFEVEFLLSYLCIK